ncbi:uncharacterized protein PF3D7_1120000-like [Cardiocondyla obscurior]|uniref:uncharacterized protein PF3D7_1120000-like n=1 Tax=Cardiocondyla obscurior TaxID=286306 RepID=UPI0039656DEB
MSDDLEQENKEKEEGENVELKEGEEKGKKKLGRPCKAESWGRDRSNSLPIIRSLKKGEKRKERQGEDSDPDKGEVFKKSLKIGRSSVKVIGSEGNLMEMDKDGEVEKQRTDVNVLQIVREMRAGFEAIRKELREVHENKKEVKKWIEDLRKDWGKEKEMLVKKIEGLEKRIKEKEEKKRKKELEKSNVIKDNTGKDIQGIKKKKMDEIKEGEAEGMKRQVEEIIKDLGVNAKIEEVRKIEGINKSGFGMVWVKFENFKGKLDVMKEKGKLKDRKEWISNDLAVYERKVKWKIKVEAEKLRKEGKRVKIRYMKLWVEDVM